VSPHLDNSKIDILHRLNDRIFDKSKSFDLDQLFSYLQTIFSNDLAIFGHDHLCTAKNYEALGILLQMQGKFEQTLENYYKCLAIELKLLPNNHPKLAKTYECIGNLHVLTNDQSQGLTSYQNAIIIQIKSLPDNHFEIANLYKKNCSCLR
jgi:tetratricopeptide (TPR) repeat protein